MRQQTFSHPLYEYGRMDEEFWKKYLQIFKLMQRHSFTQIYVIKCTYNDNYGQKFQYCTECSANKQTLRQQYFIIVQIFTKYLIQFDPSLQYLALALNLLLENKSANHIYRMENLNSDKVRDRKTILEVLTQFLKAAKDVLVKAIRSQN